jgi:ligand-binding sensor domain-containing protein
LRRVILHIALLIFFHDEIASQDLLFRKLEVARKLSDTKIALSAQDSMGFLWLGSNKGIWRYNGADYIQTELPDSLKESGVTCINICGDEVLAGFHNGCIARIPLKQPRNATILKVTGVSVTDCIKDYLGNLWIGTDGVGLYILRKDEQVVHLYKKSGLPDNEITQILQIQNEIMVATDLGLSICTWNGSEVNIKILNADNGLGDNLITSLCSFRNQYVLIGYYNGNVDLVNVPDHHIDSLHRSSKIPSVPVKKIMVIDQDIWAIYKNGEGLVLNPNTHSVKQKNKLVVGAEQNLDSKVIADISCDSDGNIIVCNQTNEIFIADSRYTFFFGHEGVEFSDIKAICVDHRDWLWFATKSGLYAHHASFNENELIKPILTFNKQKKDIISIAEGPDSAIWFGTFGDGLGRVDPKTKKVTHYTEKNGLSNNNVLSIASARGKLYLGTLGGLCEAIPGKKISFKEIELSTYGAGYIYNVHKDYEDRIWIGTDGKGPAVLTEFELKFIRDDFPDLGKSITAISSDRNGVVWFNSVDKGIQRFDGKVVLTLDLSNESQKPEIFAIHCNDQGGLVVFSSLGLSVFESDDRGVFHFNPGIPLVSDFLNVMSTDQSGNLWIGSNDALLRLNLFRSLNIRPPTTRIEEILVMLQNTDSLNHTFSYDQNHFTFHISGIWFNDPEALSYQYKLEGLDLDWVNTRDHILVFPKLQPGKYTLRIRSTLTGDWARAHEASYSFVINPPYWQRWWFILIILLSTGLVIYVIIQVRIRILRRKSDLQKERIQSQFETLRNQVNPHFLFNSFNTLITIIEKDQTEAIDFVEKISDYFRIILLQREKEVIDLEQELELVSTYLFLQSKRFGDNLQTKIEIAQPFRNSFIPPLSLQILAENIIKHNVISKAKPLTISIVSVGEWIEVRNTLQEKTHKEPSTGVGLQNIRNRYQVLFNKEIEVLKLENEFLVRLPIIEVMP